MSQPAHTLTFDLPAPWIARCARCGGRGIQDGPPAQAEADGRDARILDRKIQGHGHQDQKSATVHYSITSSARCRSDGGIVRPMALAVLRLMTSSYLEACSTGRSAGLAPLRILSM